METTSENTETKALSTLTDHYAGPGEAVTWTSQGKEKWSRNIPGIGGGLQATEESDKVVTLQLTDLQGNIVATAADNEEETKLRSTYNSTEYGVPNEGKTPPKYAWLGASGLATETAFGTGIATQGGASYIPQVARDLQTAPIIPPGAFPNGHGSGEEYTPTISTGALASAEAIATQLYAEAEAARQEAKRREAEETCAIASECVQREEGELVDPEGLASYKRTLQRAKELEKDARNGFLIGLAVDVVVDGAAETGAEYASQLIEAAQHLKECVSYGKNVKGKKGSWGTCYINEWRVNVGLVSIPWTATAEFCGYIGKRSWGKKSHNLYECEASKVTAWGPWF